MPVSQRGARMRATEMRDANLLRTGIVGSVIVALCCLTPVLVLVLGAVGLSAVMGWLDIVLLPALAVFLGITAYALWRRQHTA
jgi:mercuric ion transport protein